MTNPFKAALQAGQIQRGLWCTINDSLIAEACAQYPFDWMLFDTEHSALDPASVVPLLQAIAPYRPEAVVRPSSLDPAQIKKLLDLGARNILVPMVHTGADAALAVASVTYPPEGIRGVSYLSRASRFGTVPGYLARAREEIAILVQIESREGLENLDAIATTPGVDGIFIGPADLGAALGFGGDPSHPDLQDIVVDAVARIVAHGVPVGFLSADEAFVDRVEAAGALFVSRDLDILALRRGLEARIGAACE